MAVFGKTGDTHLVRSAQDLRAGDVIYQRADQSWSRDIAEAKAFATDDPAAQTALAAGLADEANLMSVALAEVRLDAKNRPYPTHFREVFRTRGPSNRFLGKQAQALN